MQAIGILVSMVIVLFAIGKFIDLIYKSGEQEKRIKWLEHGMLDLRMFVEKKYKR
jgi:hypothetical protein